MDSGQLLRLLRSTPAIGESMKRGILIHQKIITQGLQYHVPLRKTLIHFYLSCNSYTRAKLVLQNVENPFDITSWNGLLAAYTRNSMFVEALELFQQLLQSPHLNPDCYTYPSLLKACGGLKIVGLGEMVHTRVVKAGVLSDVVVASSLVGMYAKCDVFECAIEVFEKMPDKDAASWNSIISCYYHSGQCFRALEMYETMKCFGFEPDSVTLTTAISSCARLMDLEWGKKLHLEVLQKGFQSDGFASSALVDMYGKCGSVDTAREIFEKIRAKGIVAWNSIISAYSLQGDIRRCMELFKRMNEEETKPSPTTIGSLLTACSRSADVYSGKFMHGYVLKNVLETDVFIVSSLIDFYFKCGAVRSAECVFHQITEPDMVFFNVMISGYVTVGCSLEALGTFNDMKTAGVRPDGVTFASALSACSQLVAVEEGKEIHDCIVGSRFEKDELVMGALLDMYAKCGAIEEALSVFEQLPERDLVSWTSMITAYGSHGRPVEALKLFECMQGANIKPDGVTFLAVLSACSHGGLIDEGHHHFNEMQFRYGIKPRVEHYSCLVDLLGRAGRLHEAYDILQKEPGMKENADVLRTLLSACRLHRDFQLGVEIAGVLIEKDPDDPSTYVMLAHMYASLHRWDEARKVRLKLRGLGLKKNPGCSWIEFDKMIHTFLAEDTSHPQVEAIRECLATFRSHMEEDRATELEDW